MREFKIEIRRCVEPERYAGSYQITQGGLVSDPLSYDECIGLFAALMARDCPSPRSLEWMKPPKPRRWTLRERTYVLLEDDAVLATVSPYPVPPRSDNPEWSICWQWHVGPDELQGWSGTEKTRQDAMTAAEEHVS